MEGVVPGGPWSSGPIWCEGTPNPRKSSGLVVQTTSSDARWPAMNASRARRSHRRSSINAAAKRTAWAPVMGSTRMTFFSSHRSNSSRARACLASCRTHSAYATAESTISPSCSASCRRMSARNRIPVSRMTRILPRAELEARRFRPLDHADETVDVLSALYDPILQVDAAAQYFALRRFLGLRHASERPQVVGAQPHLTDLIHGHGTD
jgi:hypothetical protein